MKLLQLLDKAKTLPKKPGCYLMKNKNGEVIYVGKAKSLKNRVVSYFQNGAKTPKTEILVTHIRDFEFILTQTDSESFVLENNLIKKYSPKYNILMRDDKSYPYIVVNNNEPFPRPIYERRPKRGKNIEVFGPFVVGSNISEVLRVLIKSFNLRDCTLREFNSRKDPCLLYQMKQCSAPCVGKIDDISYSEDLTLCLDFFRGNGDKSISVLQRQMIESSEREEFEHAAILRDNIDILKNFVEFSQQKNAELNTSDKDLDVIAYHKGEIEIDLAIYMVRNSLLLGHKVFHFPTIDCSEDIGEEIKSFLFQYYTDTFDSLPEKIITEFADEILVNSLESVFIERENKIVKVQKPNKSYKPIFDLTKDYAYEQQRVRISNEDSVFIGLNKLKDLLKLKERPKKLECYDVAIWQGQSPTASQIVFIDGKPSKKDYRYYHLETLPEGNNDFAMMKELIERRIKSGELPDVMIIDGGKGQLSTVIGVLEDLKISIPVVSLAKAKTKSDKTSKQIERTEERLFIPGRSNPYILRKNKSLFQISTQMRDEAHRFSRKLHHKAEQKRTLNSWLDAIPGIGPKTKNKVLRSGISRIAFKNMSKEELAKECRITYTQAESILKYLEED